MEESESTNESQQTPSLVSITGEGPSRTYLTKTDLQAHIDTTLTDKISKIGGWIITLLLVAVFGGIVTGLWTTSSKVNEVYGKYSNPDGFIQSLNNRIELLEKENGNLKLVTSD